MYILTYIIQLASFNKTANNMSAKFCFTMILKMRIIIMWAYISFAHKWANFGPISIKI